MVWYFEEGSVVSGNVSQAHVESVDEGINRDTHVSTYSILFLPLFYMNNIKIVKWESML